MPLIPDKETRSAAARSKLLMAGLYLFAEKGFEGTTTREICARAGANVSAIRYYFGDKAGLYRAAFTEPMGDKACHFSIETGLNLPLSAALQQFFKEFLAPLKQGDELHLVMKLHFREMLEPTGAWQQEINTEIKPQHNAMIAMIKRRLGATRSDIDLHRLAFAIIGMAVHFYVGYDVVQAIAPQVIDTPEAIDALSARLTVYAMAMIEAEDKNCLAGTGDAAG